MNSRCLALALCLLLCWSLAAQADTVLNGEAFRTVRLTPAGENQAPEGISPTTGRVLNALDKPETFAGLAVTGRYMPMLVQIDNSGGGIGNYAPWGAAYADIVYETPLRKNAATRLSFLFSDLIPDAVGPVRSARVGHVWLRKEWDCGFMYFGGQTKEGSNIQVAFRETGARMGEVLFSGADGQSKAWVRLYTTRAGCTAPSNQSGNAAAVSALIPAAHVAPNHAFLFTDDLPTGGDAATELELDWGMNGYNSTLVYQPEFNRYVRFMHRDGGHLAPWVDRDTGELVTFSNLIIQYVTCTWNNSTDAPVTELVGEGNCELFMGGRHLSGIWQRASMDARTVFYGDDGTEAALQRGRTLIVIFPKENLATYR